MILLAGESSEGGGGGLFMICASLLVNAEEAVWSKD